MNPTELIGLAHRIADRAVVSDIETAGVAETDAQGRRWYDTRPMLDPREQPDDFIEMTVQALTYAHERGLVSPHPGHPHLVRTAKAVA